MSVDDSRLRSRSPSKDRDSNNFHDRVYEPQQEQYSSVDNTVEVYPTSNSTSTSENQTTTLTNGIPADPEFNLKCRLFIGSLSFAVCLSAVVYIFSCY